MSKSNITASRLLEPVCAFIFVFSLIIIFFVDGLNDSFRETAEYRAKLDSLRSSHSKLKSDYKKIKEKARSTDPRVIWLARAIYSETKKKKEMRYVGWVIRNRLEAKFRGAESYPEVILSSYQFSAFNPNSSRRIHYLTLSYYQRNELKTWNTALNIAKEIVYKEKHNPLEPLTKDTYWFYSEISMEGRRHPEWKYDYKEVKVASVKDVRFRFYKDPDYDYITNESVEEKNGHTTTR